jgi:hypothetical protein
MALKVGGLVGVGGESREQLITVRGPAESGSHGGHRAQSRRQNTVM